MGLDRFKWVSFNFVPCALLFVLCHETPSMGALGEKRALKWCVIFWSSPCSFRKSGYKPRNSGSFVIGPVIAEDSHR